MIMFKSLTTFNYLNLNLTTFFYYLATAPNYQFHQIDKFCLYSPQTETKCFKRLQLSVENSLSFHLEVISIVALRKEFSNENIFTKCGEIDASGSV